MKDFINFAFLLFMIACKHGSFGKKDHGKVPTYFRKIDYNGELIDRRSSNYQNPIPKRILTRVSREDAESAVLKIKPAVIENGSNVTITWLGIKSASEKDYIALYCPGDDKPTHILDYFNVNVDPRWEQGIGANTVHVYNIRTTCVFKYYRHTGDAAQLVVSSNELSFRGGPLAPLQIHLALTNDPTQMRIMWVSGYAKQAIVKYGKTTLNRIESKFNVNTYTGSQLCHSPANDTGFWNPGYIYDVLLGGLEVDTDYFYTVGNEEVQSKVMIFRTAIPSGSRKPYKFIAYGDQGIDPFPQGKTTAYHVKTDILKDKNYRFIFHNGDISYALGYAYIWDQWFALIEPYASTIPYMVGIGNHEYDHTFGGEHDPSKAKEEGYHPIWGNFGDDSNGECGVPMYNRFKMPMNGNNLWWYSYDYGLVHFIMMSTEHDFSPQSKQYQWLEKDLRFVDRSKTPWIIIGGHRAMYCSALIPDDYVVSLNMQRLFENLLYKYKVDLAFWAHYHSYERTCKVYQQQCQDDGVLHMVIGSAGRSTDHDIWLPKVWSKYHHVGYGYGRVSVLNETALYWEWVLNSSGEVKDTFWLTK